MATFQWGIAVHSVGCMFSLYFDYFYLVISRFGFEGLIWVLIASGPGLCILFTFHTLKKGISFAVKFSLCLDKEYLV